VVSYNSVLNLEHFQEDEFRKLVREAFAHGAKAFDDFPDGREMAKIWEITQAIRGLRDFGALRPDAELLGVAAGHEHTVFYLTNYVRRVFATDLYATNENWQEAARGMLSEPEQFATPGMKWAPERLVVQHMDALKLSYEDNSFDGIFSCGSIEHFGSLENVSQSAREMGRVLKRGGVLTLSTEFRLEGNPESVGIPGALIFTEEMLREYVVEASGLRLVDDISTSVTPATAAAAYPLEEAILNGVRKRSIALEQDGFKWTSISLCLVKD